MKHGFLKVAAATPDIFVNATKKNGENIAKLINEAAETGVKVLALPELCVCGYTLGDLLMQEDIRDRVYDALSYILDETKNSDILFALGVPVLYMDKIYNCGAVCKGGKVLGFVPKSYLPNYGEFHEVRYFGTIDDTVEVPFGDYTVPMGTKLIFCAKQMDELRISCELCEDMWVSVPPSAKHTQNGATVILNLSANSETPGKHKAREMMVASNSMREVCAYIYADAGQGESTTDTVFAGDNMIFECGKKIAEAEMFENGITSGVIDLQKITAIRKQRNTFIRKFDKGYQKIYFDIDIDETKVDKINSAPFVPRDKDTMMRTFKMQCKGLEKRLRHIGAKTVTIGVSGGLDSTLALLVAVQTFDNLGLDRKGIISVSMPCFGTSKRTFNNSKALAEAFGTTYREIPIGDAVKKHLEDIGASIEDHDVTYENAQARERTQILMDIANKTGGIVIGTGDLSELALGFATYNGDHMSMYGVNSSIPKTLMRAIVLMLAEELGGDSAEILRDVVGTPVSPELLPGDENDEIRQKTEEIIGAYDVHDFVLYYFVKYGFSREKISRMARIAFGDKYAEGLIENWIKIFYKRFFANQFKRSASPDGVKATGVSLSQRGDWIMPSDAVLE